VSGTQIVYAGVLITVLVAVAGFFAWRQVLTLRGLRGNENLPPEDRRYARFQAWRRLVCCALMVVFAGLLGGSFFLEADAQRMADEHEAARAQDENAEFNPQDKDKAGFYAGYWITALLVLLGMVTLAFFDLLAIRRYGRRHFQKLQADRRAMLQRQVSRLRQERNGHA
jgi:hypothetical protein